MNRKIGYVSLLVPNYNEAKDYYTRALGFTLLKDTDLGDGKRWVVISPGHDEGTGLVLTEAKTDEEKAAVGKQGAGRVWLFLHTDDFKRDHWRFQANGVRFLEQPREEPYGTVAVFEDRYGNKWDLLELKP
ncbi:VOC family protein [Opitutia bacterium ISCC 51]|nr:VOC family protein [Opitutae bacterium ISCC 51]QXD29527.1 VOC family protein [Opitutae bacterium ISCC 52]